MSQQATSSPSFAVVPHTVNRLVFRTTDTYDELRSRYEAAVPAFQWSMIEAAASWDEVLKLTADAAAAGFLLYGRVEIDPFMVRNGHTARSTTYLMGNHTVAETMYGHNAGVMLYAPLRTVIYEDPDGIACFAVDQPSTRFASFDNPAITATGHALDARLAGLLETLGLPVPEGLTASA